MTNQLIECLKSAKAAGMSDITQLLGFIWIADKGGKILDLKKMAMIMGTTKVAACNALTTFRKNKLINQSRAEEDNRKVVTILTKKGEDLATKLSQVCQQEALTGPREGPQ